MLEDQPIKPSTLLDYRRRLDKLNSWAGRQVERCRSPDLDCYLIDFFDHRFMEGAGLDEGQKLLAAVCHFQPRFSRFGGSFLPRAHRALKGWRRLAPQHARTPLPWIALMAMIGWAVHLNRRALASCMLLGFTAYLRPSELVELTSASLVPPQTSTDSRLKFWAIIVRPLELGIPAKTGDFDESVLLNAPYLEWFGDVLQVLRQQPCSRPLWPFNLHEFGQQMQEIATLAEVSHLRVEPYSLRHGGASHDALMGYRDLASIKERGRWKADSSVARYKKAARALQRIGLLDDRTIEYGKLIEHNLRDLLLGKISLPPPTLAPGLRRC